MKLKSTFSISRPHCSDGTEIINVRIEDDISGITFVDLEMSYSEFTRAITGATAHCEMEVRGLEKVGKKIERDTLIFPMPKNSDYSNRKKLAIREAKQRTPEGWEASEYYGSQDSFFRKDGREYARTNIYRWVEETI